MKLFFLSFTLLFLFFSCSQNKAIHITEFSQKDTNNAILIDVRTPVEFAEGHLENAKNINWFDKNFEEQIKSLDKEETIYVYCKKGGRSAKAASLLDSLGFKNVINLQGGYDAYLFSLQQD
ncbi:rhodanese-related sulfurtransferase [Maribacter vaceletii]|uniref:Rhodanese-related sulfurtransferase n=1 Tax=Maribacter vaceletii TaxID=1206816 RepID=A0A495EDS8_9FLAO|nr:rhodanese-like domain-containing protein [Maribacter vaceletii]RKR14047.1 rhodanese-related sulfurtransferase [Maribacter vaceletii]